VQIAVIAVRLHFGHTHIIAPTFADVHFYAMLHSSSASKPSPSLAPDSEPTASYASDQRCMGYVCVCRTYVGVYACVLCVSVYGVCLCAIEPCVCHVSVSVVDVSGCAYVCVVCACVSSRLSQRVCVCVCVCLRPACITLHTHARSDVCCHCPQPDGSSQHSAAAQCQCELCYGVVTLDSDRTSG
jgi:hypothetical protein